jgi:hypothetical protein
MSMAPRQAAAVLSNSVAVGAAPCRENAEQLPQAMDRHRQIRIDEPLQQRTGGAEPVLISEDLRVDWAVWYPGLSASVFLLR